ncbi:MAG: hypothetical protein ABR499_01865 [Gemmatimonadaceae bacterium]
MAQQTNFTCPACGAAFSTRKELESHNREAHERSTERTGDASSREQPEWRGEPGPGESGEVF